MPKFTFSTNDLMNELDIIGDYSVLNKTLKFYGFKKIYSDQEIDKSLANDILYAIRRKNIDWYFYKERERDLISNSGTLNRPNLEIEQQVKENITSISNKLKITEIKKDTNNRILGLMTEGGFLKLPHSHDFKITIKNGTNVFIGNRGSGKSTILQLFSLVSGSISEEATSFINIILNQLNQNDNNEKELYRKIKKTLILYNIKRYSMFFIFKGKIYCFYMDTENLIYDLFQHIYNRWISISKKKSIFEVIPSMQIFHQSEIVKIAEDNENFYLNNILDLLYEDLLNQRKKFANKIKKLSKQYEYYTPIKNSLNLSNLRKFIFKQESKLDSVVSSFKKNNLTPLVEIVDDYLNINENFYKMPIYDLIQGDEKNFIYLYIGNISKFLKEKVQALKSEIKNSEENKIQKNIRTDEELFKDFIDDKVNKQVALIAKDIIHFLRNRIRAVKNYISIYSNLPISYEKDVESLVIQYKNLLENKIKLEELQNLKCIKLTSSINKDNLRIEIISDKNNRYNNIYINKIDMLSSQYSKLITSNLKIKPKNLYELSADYERQLNSILKDIQRISENRSKTNAFIFGKISIKLKQGKINRSFEKLSYGQKSGIILKMVLEATQKDIIILDQPEDNMDATSIIKMLIPTFNRISKNKQLLIATHNSNLVMGLEGNIIAMHSKGEYGNVRQQGTLNNRNVVKSMIDILEGDISTFGQKMTIYYEFIRKLNNLTKIIDLEIESSFRKKTIDGLRNSLQPIINDKSLLDTLRHELKQFHPNKYHNVLNDINIKLKNNIKEINIEEINSILKNMDNLSLEIEEHISKMIKDIETIRSMDMNPQPSNFDLYNMLQEIIDENHILMRIKSGRLRINIDKKIINTQVFSDRRHLKLVFQNIFNNSIRATENIAKRNRKYIQNISIELNSINTKDIIIFFKDNGSGMSSEIKRKLYIEPCSDRAGRGTDHGIGATIIKKFLTINSANIKIIHSAKVGKNMGTTQKITLKKGEIV